MVRLNGDTSILIKLNYDKIFHWIIASKWPSGFFNRESYRNLRFGCQNVCISTIYFFFSSADLLSLPN